MGRGLSPDLLSQSLGLGTEPSGKLPGAALREALAGLEAVSLRGGRSGEPGLEVGQGRTPPPPAKQRNQSQGNVYSSLNGCLGAVVVI